VPGLLDALKSKDTQLIYESLVAIQKIRDPETASGIAFLLQDLNEKVQLTAIETTGLLMNKKALPDLNEALNRDKKVKVRAAVLSAMAMIPDESSRPVYEKYIADRDDSLRASAAEGYARLKNPSDLERMSKLFEDETKMKSRLGLAFAACGLGKTELSEFSPLQYLVNTLNSASYRGVASAYLRELARDRKIRESLYAVINDRTNAEKLELAMILAREGDADTVPILENLTRDKNVEVGKSAAQALRNLKARLP
jgi:HEAT repeat protein